MDTSIYTVDIHDGSPIVEVAMRRFDNEFEYALEARANVFKVIVGYGSSGGTHKIADAVYEKLIALKYDREILDFIKGSDLASPHLRISSSLKKMIPPEDKRIANPGVYYVFLRKN